MLGYGEQELLQKTVRDITHVDDLESTQEIQLELSPGRLARPRKTLFAQRRFGSLGPIAGTSVRERSGQPQCFVAVVHDITELKLAQDALGRANRAFAAWWTGLDWYGAGVRLAIVRSGTPDRRRGVMSVRFLEQLLLAVTEHAAQRVVRAQEAASGEMTAIPTAVCARSEPNSLAVRNGGSACRTRIRFPLASGSPLMPSNGV